MICTVGLVGGRGHTGRELIRLIAARNDLKLEFVSSRELAGQSVRDVAPEAAADLVFEALGPDVVANRKMDAVILALPNGASSHFVEAIERACPRTIIIDLSADYRFDDGWLYGLPEIYGRARHQTATRISNPGCYATAGQLAVAPLRDRLEGDIHVFGVSGYSGAGTSPSRKNDTRALNNNLMPYALTGHLHELEMRRHLGCRVRFTPHVAEFFRGIVATVHMSLDREITRVAVLECYREAYLNEPLIQVTDDIPEVRDGAYQPGAVIGGFALDQGARHLVVVATLDNLLKGAAVQALQNLTLALGLPEQNG
jgi:N-acetyl-gamma-glutamyl-phosphate reductase